MTIGKLLSLALGLLGFAIRCVISYNVLWLLYSSCWGVYFWVWAGSPKTSLYDLLLTFLVAGAFAPNLLPGMTDHEYLQLLSLLFAATSSVIAIAWGRVCRQKCWPASGALFVGSRMTR